jgi:hypothetical protein
VYPRPSRRFHTGLAIALLVTAVAGFGPTYFYKGFYPSAPLTLLLHLHGVVFTAWLVLLVVQSGLIAVHRVDLHRRFGIVGALLAAVMIPVGVMTAIDGARRGVATLGLDPLVFMVFPIGAIVMFTAFIGAALLKRRKPETHRALILLGTVSIMTPAIARLPFAGRNPVLALVISLLFVIAAMIHDWVTRRRINQLYLWGGVLIFLSGPVRSAVGHSTAWRDFAEFLAR